MSDLSTISLAEAVRVVLADSPEPLTPQQIRDRIKNSYPHLYKTEAHQRGIEKGNYHHFDHALLAPIYTLVTNSADFSVDRSTKPMHVSLVVGDEVEDAFEENYEEDIGTVYVLSTGTYTSSGRRIVKIGHTTQPLLSRIAQLYTTGTPFQFEELHSWRTQNYIELEHALHRLLAPFRMNRAREFFSDEALAFIEPVVQIHFEVQALRNKALSS